MVSILESIYGAYDVMLNVMYKTVINIQKFHNFVKNDARIRLSLQLYKCVLIPTPKYLYGPKELHNLEKFYLIFRKKKVRFCSLYMS